VEATRLEQPISQLPGRCAPPPLGGPVNNTERDLLTAQMITWKAREMLRDALRKILPHLPNTTAEAEKVKVAIAATKDVCDLIHETLCRAEDRRVGKIVPIRRR